MPPFAPIDVIHARPGKAALGLLTEQVSALKRDDVFARVVIVVPGYFAGRAVRLHLGQSGGVVNVEILYMAELVRRLTAGLPRMKPRLTAALEEAAVREAVRSHGGHFSGLTHHASLHRALVQLYRDMRRHEVSACDPSFRDQLTAQSAAACYTAFRRLTSEYNDVFRVREIAAELVENADACPQGLGGLAGIIVWLPAEFGRVEARMAAACRRWCPVCVVLPRVKNGNKHLRDIHDGLGTVGASGVLDVDLASQDIALSGDTDLRIVRAPDPMEEMREIVRRIAADLESGIPLHRIAVLYRSTQTGGMIQEALDRAEFPFLALEGKPLSETRPGRCLTALLRIVEDDFAVSSVLGWVELRGESEVAASVAMWARLAREAHITTGAQQWRERLISFAERRTDDAADLSHMDRRGAVHQALDSAKAARAISAVVMGLSAVLQPPPVASWSEWLLWMDRLAERHAHPGENGRVDEQESFVDMRDVIASLGKVADLVPHEHVQFGLFASTVRGALRSRTQHVGKVGQSIVVGSVNAATGLAFDRVYIVGMIEGVFPPPPPVDPFFSNQATAPVQTRERHRSREWVSFFSAMAAADGGRLTLSTSDASGERAAFPSRWLLEIVQERLSLTSFGQGDFRMLNAAEHSDWFRVIASSVDGVRALSPSPNAGSSTIAVAADLEDRRLGIAVDWVIRRGMPLTEHALARRQDLPLSRGLRVSSERRGAALTECDGNVEIRAGGSTRLSNRLSRAFDGSRRMSPSALEEWAVCPFRFFVHRVLGVDPTSDIRDEDVVDPMTRGSLIHNVVSDYYGERIGKELSDDAEAVARIHDIAAHLSNALGPHAALGHPLVWENARAVIGTDLRRLLQHDVRLAAKGTIVAHVEQSFGMDGSDSWPPLTLSINGRRIQFRGRIDRVDQTPSGAMVIDYKTGIPFSTDKDWIVDPIAAGEHLQVALYGLAVQTFTQNENVSGAYWFATSRGGFKQRTIEVTDPETLARTMAVLSGILEGIEHGSFPQVPGAGDRSSFTNCRYCDYADICPNDREVLWQRKQGDPQSDLHAKLVLSIGSNESIEVGDDV